MMDIHKAVWPGWQAVRPIGSGSAGEVYEIQRDVYGRPERAALKVISLPREDGEIQELFGKGYDLEAVKQHFKRRLDDLVSTCSVMLEMKGHPNVVYCDDMRYEPHADGIGWDLFLKMELLTPLSDVLSQPFDEEQVIGLGINICDALAACAKRGIIHEAVKPENIFLSVDGNYKLGDFGSARATARPCGGDLSCMAPEVYWGMPYSASADVYALGLVMYRMLNGGNLPFVQPSFSRQEMDDACVRRLTGEDLLPPAQGSQEFRQLVLHTCSYAAAQRIGSVQALREALQALRKPEAAISAAPEQEQYRQNSLAHPEQPATGTVQGSYRQNSLAHPQQTDTGTAQGSCRQNSLAHPQQPRMDTVQPEFADPIPMAVVEEAPAPKPKKSKGLVMLLVAVAAAVLVLGVAGFFTIHIWTKPSCNEVKQCKICGKTAGRAQDHRWEDADCDQPKTCAVCGETQGQALGHQWIAATKTAPATCSVCGAEEGTVVLPKLWVVSLISSGWEGGHQYSCQGTTAKLAFPEAPSFSGCDVSYANADGAPLSDDAFAAEWVDGVACITPSQDLEMGVYNIQFQNGQEGGAMLSICYGYAQEAYMSASEYFWSGSIWRSEAHGGYLAIEDGQVTTVTNAGNATSFGSHREMFAVEVEASGNAAHPVVGEPVTMQTMSFVRDGEGGPTAFCYNGWYLACDSQGNVYMSKELNEECFWLEGR